MTFHRPSNERSRPATFPPKRSPVNFSRDRSDSLTIQSRPPSNLQIESLNRDECLREIPRFIAVSFVGEVRETDISIGKRNNAGEGRLALVEFPSIQLRTQETLIWLI